MKKKKKNYTIRVVYSHIGVPIQNFHRSQLYPRCKLISDRTYVVVRRISSFGPNNRNNFDRWNVAIFFYFFFNNNNIKVGAYILLHFTCPRGTVDLGKKKERKKKINRIVHRNNLYPNLEYDKNNKVISRFTTTVHRYYNNFVDMHTCSCRNRRNDSISYRWLPLRTKNDSGRGPTNVLWQI